MLQWSLKKLCFSFHFRFFQNRAQTISPVHVTTKFAMQPDKPCKKVYPGSSHYSLNKPLIFNSMKIWLCTFLTTCGCICHQKFSKKAYFDRTVSHVQETVDSTGVMNEEHKCVCGGGGTLQGHHFNALLLCSFSLAGHASEQMCLKWYAIWMANKMPSVISLMKKALAKHVG